MRDQPLDASRLVSWAESVAPGKCLRVTVGAQGEGSGVELRAFDAADGSEVERSESAHAASVHVCSPADAARGVRFEARASAGHMDAVIGERTTAN